MENRYYVYILTNKSKTVLYTGVTNNVERRIEEHIQGAVAQNVSFASKYKCFYLLYFEEYQQIQEAISREKIIKGQTRDKKIALIKAVNPEMKFLNK